MWLFWIFSISVHPPVVFLSSVLISCLFIIIIRVVLSEVISYLSVFLLQSCFCMIVQVHLYLRGQFSNPSYQFYHQLSFVCLHYRDSAKPQTACCFSLVPADVVQEIHPEAHRPQDGHRLAGAARGPEALLQVRMRSTEQDAPMLMIQVSQGDNNKLTSWLVGLFV